LTSVHQKCQLLKHPGHRFLFEKCFMARRTSPFLFMGTT
jgi:hypothetical protein